MAEHDFYGIPDSQRYRCNKCGLLWGAGEGSTGECPFIYELAIDKTLPDCAYDYLIGVTCICGHNWNHHFTDSRQGGSRCQFLTARGRLGESREITVCSCDCFEAAPREKQRG